MKEIKVFVHRRRAADVIEAIKGTSAWAAHEHSLPQHHLAITAVQGTLEPMDDAERHYSVLLGLEVVNEFRLELHCDDDCVEELVDAIRTSARTGRPGAGWIYITDVTAADIQ